MLFGLFGPCPLNAPVSSGKKLDVGYMETKGATHGDSGERKSQLKNTSLKLWKYRTYSLLSTKRWRRK